MGKRIQFRTSVLSNSSKQQLYDYFDNRKKAPKAPRKSVLFGDAFGTLHFWR